MGIGYLNLRYFHKLARFASLATLVMFTRL